MLRSEEVLEFPVLADRWRTETHDGVVIRVPGSISDHAAYGEAASAKPLSAVRVLDLSWVWSGPAVSVALADLGADVIKIESATRPDNSRLRGRPERGVRDPQAPSIEVQPYFHALNRGKRSVSLDLRTEGGRELLWKLAKHADIIIENLSAGVMDRFGIPPERVLESNPSCVFLSMRGFRAHPTTERLKAYAPTLSSAAGIEALVGYPGETPIGAMTIAFSDALASGQGTLAALAGLYRRAVHGSGSVIMLSQHEAAVLANGHNLVSAQLGEQSSLRPFSDDAALVVPGGALNHAPWISPDLFAAIHPRFMDEVSVARLPWRRDGALPSLGAAAPMLGEHTDLILETVLSISGARRDDLARDGALT